MLLDSNHLVSSITVGFRFHLHNHQFYLDIAPNDTNSITFLKIYLFSTIKILLWNKQSLTDIVTLGEIGLSIYCQKIVHNYKWIVNAGKKGPVDRKLQVCQCLFQLPHKTHVLQGQSDKTQGHSEEFDLSSPI